MLSLSNSPSFILQKRQPQCHLLTDGRDPLSAACGHPLLPLELPLFYLTQLLSTKQQMLMLVTTSPAKHDSQVNPSSWRTSQTQVLAFSDARKLPLIPHACVYMCVKEEGVAGGRGSMNSKGCDSCPQNLFDKNHSSLNICSWNII